MTEKTPQEKVAEVVELLQGLLDDGVISPDELVAVLEHFGRLVTDPDEIAYIEFLSEGGKRS